MRSSPDSRFQIPDSLPRASRAAFTLIEILIVVGITTVLASMILTYTSTSRDQVALYVEEAKLAQSISRAKSLAIATFNQPEIPCGYGMHLDYDAQTYTIFSYSAPQCVIGNTLDLSGLDAEDCQAGGACAITTEVLPPNVALTDGGDNPIQDVLFIPPDPKTWIWRLDDLATTTSGNAYLRTPGGTQAVIGVSQAGQITF